MSFTRFSAFFSITVLICLLFTSLQVDARLQVNSAAKFRGNYGVQYTGLAPVQTARTQMMAGEGEAEAEGEGESEEAAAVPAVPVVPVADNYEAATNADDLITKALEHGTLSAAQAKAILAAAKAAASADAAKVAAAKKIVEAAKDAEGEAAKAATDANEAAASAAAKVAADEKQLRADEDAAGPPAAIAQQKQAALNSANQRLAAAMAYAATQTRNMDRALAAETAAKEAESARIALAEAKVKADNAEVAARNLADVSSFSGSSSGSNTISSGGKTRDSSLGEKIGIAVFFLLLAGALLFWWFQYGRGSGSEGQGMTDASQSNYGTYTQAQSYGREDTSV
mmetsp:Transcript_15715/g.52609  ORF Transcript_15715/g.52609 Transcript_15715/m.52609 type:complete len:341 (-) Transcript_15715:106-1128(-)